MVAHWATLSLMNRFEKNFRGQPRPSRVRGLTQIVILSMIEDTAQKNLDKHTS